MRRQQMTDRRDEKDVDIATRLRELTEQLRGVRTELVKSLRPSRMPVAPPRDRPLPGKDVSGD